MRGSRRDSHESVQLGGEEAAEKSPDERGERGAGDGLGLGLGLKSGGEAVGAAQERQREGRGAVQRPWFERSVLTAVSGKVGAIMSMWWLSG
jgi:hypothetical protein